eukprot:gene5836-11780_t
MTQFIQYFLYCLWISTIISVQSSLLSLILRHPINGSQIDTEYLSVKFDCYGITDPKSHMVCFQFWDYESKSNTDISIFDHCWPLLEVWPNELAPTEIKMNLLMNGRRTVRLALISSIDSDQFYKYVQSSDFADFHVVLNSRMQSFGQDTFVAKDRELLFDEVYTRQFWRKGLESVQGTEMISLSGVGSSPTATEAVRSALAEVLTTFNITFLFDTPCGDLVWMSRMNFASLPHKVSYVGGDISRYIIDRNNERITAALDHVVLASSSSDHDLIALGHMLQSTQSVTMTVVDLAAEFPVFPPVPPDVVSVIFCRHMMIHMSIPDNLAVLKNVQSSGFNFFMATTYLRESENHKNFRIVLGHKLNLLQPPYCLRAPLRLYRDSSGPKHWDGSDIYMGLWELHPTWPLQIPCDNDEVEEEAVVAVVVE